MYASRLGSGTVASPTCETDYLYLLNVGNDQWIRKVVQHRVKPVVNLYRSPTSNGPYSEYQIRYPVEKSVTSRSCGGRTVYHTAFSAPQFSATIMPTEPYAWSNILASRVKALRVNLASDFAEYHESLRLGEDIAHRLVGFVRKAFELYRSGAWRTFRRTLYRDRKVHSFMDIPSAWLGLNLVTVPMIMTLVDIINKLNDPNNARPILRIIRFGKRIETHDLPVTDQYGGKMIAHYLSTERWKVFAVVELEANKGLWNDNFTPGNPLEWAWEAIPLSFVVDWFIPIGNYLSSLDAYKGIAGVWGTAASRNRTVVTRARRPPPIVTETEGSLVYSRYNRTAFVGGPQTSMPHWEPHPSVTKLVTALSLLVTMRGR